jgi:hypothetical protein
MKEFTLLFWLPVAAILIISFVNQVVLPIIGG